MTKTAARFLVSGAALSVIGISLFAVMYTEQKKYEVKTEQTIQYYQQSLTQWEHYQQEYVNKIAALQKENKLQMDTTKSQYTALLAKQPALISANRTTASITPPAQQQVVKKVVSVSKPSSAPKTRTS